ncbi:phospholipase A2-like [Physella acuta]|uniref:phospholipase A2-like n=1 Tax=Physella acuta TaxID=109671 RepID=UPI0027DE903F|nr:phospholipase A2-like [Physella acuta]
MTSLKVIVVLLTVTVLAFHQCDGNLQELCVVFETYISRPCMDFSSYGCSCGPSKFGVPIDGIDTCCKQKKNCYAQTSCTYNDYTGVMCSNGACLCDDTDVTSCAYKACQCDVQAAECFTQQTFNTSLISYNYTNCVVV